VTETGEASVGGLLGDKPYQERARRALPILVRQAKAGRTILYGELADELGISNPRTLGWPLGAVGNEMLKLGGRWGCKVPPIQALVVNKGSGLPGEGISWFAPDAAQFKAAPLRLRRQIIDVMLLEVFSFCRWDKVLETYGLTPLPPLSIALPSAEEIQAFDGTGEGEDHRQLKLAIAAHPEWLGLAAAFGLGETECSLYSGDRVDVVFSGQGRRVAVEVKPEGAPVPDVVRGLFQCVKYEAVMNAEERMLQSQRECSSILALGGRLRAELSSLRVTLGVEVRESLGSR
jgi:hypothetical protein